jgi:hypothetical protein
MLIRLVSGLSFIAYFYTSLRDPGFIPFSDTFKEHHKAASVSSVATVVGKVPPVSAQIQDGKVSYQSLDVSRLEVIESNQSSRSIPIEEFEGGEDLEEMPPVEMPVEQPLRNNQVIPSEQSTVSNGSELYELRFCTVCNTDQPLRAKHCSDCRRCVATYDHHCPWLGNCIGEKNKAFFYAYLSVQILEIVSYMHLMATFDEGTDMWWRVCLYVIGFVLLGLIGSLCSVQTYLISRNTTTWEFFSYKKITYLQGQKSPFSEGVLHNFLTCCSYTLAPDFRTWSLSKNVAA